MKLTKTERWILVNQYAILEHVDPDNSERYQIMQDILERGYEREYGWNTQHIYDDENVMTEQESNFVIDIMDMYDAIQHSYNRLTNKEDIEEHAIIFPGFDGNNETKHHGYATFLQQRAGKFTTLQVGNKDLNSHIPTLEMYIRMLEAWSQLNKTHELSHQDIQAILKERNHPDTR